MSVSRPHPVFGSSYHGLDRVSREFSESPGESPVGSPRASIGQSPESPSRLRSRFSSDCDPLVRLQRNNRQWSAARITEDPDFFTRLRNQQSPEYLWIGCADSRVPANQILGLDPGEVFVQRNVGNQATHTDLNCMSCLEYAVKELKVRTVLVCGHYGCGAVKAALRLPSKTQGLVNCWISDIRECRNQYRTELMALPRLELQVDRLCELNVLRQTFNVCTSPVVQSAWDRGQELHIYGIIYSLQDGLMKKLVGPISRNGDFDVDHGGILDDRAASFVGAPPTNPVRVPSKPGTGPEPDTPSATPLAAGATPAADPFTSGVSFKSRMEAFNAYINTMAVNSAIAEHVGWTDDTGGEHSGHVPKDHA